MTDILARMRQLTGTTTQWAADDLVIGDSELAFEDVGGGIFKVKIGDGATKFSALPYSLIGTDGTDGAIGAVGPAGATGPRGLAGLQGKKGDQGVAGSTGIQGIQGIQGVDGIGINVLPPVAAEADRLALSIAWTAADAGKSVLQIDTGEFWTYSTTGWANAGNLRGIQGLDGSQGVAGAQGPAGVDGVDGAAGADGADGVAGVDGADGVIGVDGKDGKDGLAGMLTRVTGGILYISTDGTQP